MSKNKDYDSIQSHLQSLNVQIEDLRKEISNPSEDHAAIAQARRKTSEHRNKAEQARIDAEKCLIEIEKYKQQIENHLSNADHVKALFGQITDIKKQTDSLSERIETVEEEVLSAEALSDRAQNLHEVIKAAESNSNAISMALKESSDNLLKIKKVHNEIYGYITNEIDEDGDPIRITGLKEKLEESFANLEQRISNLTTTLNKNYSEQSQELKNFISQKKNEIDLQIEDWTSQVSDIKEKIESHLPGAMTAGLSYAFSNKKIEESKSKVWADTLFVTSLFLLIGVSLIPFSVGYYMFISQGKDLEQIIRDLPAMSASLIPLITPLLWMAYASNKKANLSKRLVEEYSHKEALSRTVEGLSQQINVINDNGVSEELRIRLLYNLLEVSSENPGKLISDYNKADHPIIDAIEKSSQLTRAVERITKIPGISKLFEAIESKAEAKLKMAEKQVINGLDIAYGAPQKDTNGNEKNKNSDECPV